MTPTPASAPPAVPADTTMSVWIKVRVPVEDGCRICRRGGVCVCVLPGNTTVH